MLRRAFVAVDAITTLTPCGGRAAVAGLIDAYDSKLERDGVSMGIGSPDDLRDRITAALRALTGQPFGWNPAQWRQWWARDARHDPRTIAPPARRP